MNGVVLIGHGSLHSDSGASMIRLAARLRERGVAPIAEAGFLNFSRPTIAEAVAKCVRAGATSVTVQPYFLIDGVYVQQDLPGDISRVAAQFPALTIRVAACFGFHEKLAAIALERVRAADPQKNGSDGALLVMAHGTPLEAANEPVRQLSAWLHGATGYAFAAPAYLDCNSPRIAEAIDTLARPRARVRLWPCPTFCIAAATCGRTCPRFWLPRGGATRRSRCWRHPTSITTCAWPT